MICNAGGPGGLQSEINVTPLVDVVLVLLIIFMVIVPMTLFGYDVDIPGESVSTPPREPSVEQIVLGIDSTDCAVLQPLEVEGLPDHCRVRINDEVVPVTELAARIGEIFATRDVRDRVLFLVADERLNYEAVMRIVDVAKSGVEELRIGLVTAQ
jgi:biopolymer transport protein ExbD